MSDRELFQKLHDNCGISVPARVARVLAWKADGQGFKFRLKQKDFFLLQLV